TSPRSTGPSNFLISLVPPRLSLLPPLFPYTPLFRSASASGTRACSASPAHQPGPPAASLGRAPSSRGPSGEDGALPSDAAGGPRSEEHTSELQSRVDLVCRLLLEKKQTHQIDTRNYL